MMDSLMNDATVDSKRVYRQPLDYENGVLLPFIRDIAYWRVTNPKAFQNGCQSLCILLPKVLRESALKFWDKGTHYENLTGDGKKEFDSLFIHILELLEDNNICFPKLSFSTGIL